MKIKPNIRLLKSLHKQYWLLTRKTFRDMSANIIDRAGHTDPEDLKKMTINPDIMGDHLKKMWVDVGGQAFHYVAQKSGKVKLETKDGGLIVSKIKMSKYAYERSLKFKNEITNSYQESVNRVIDKAIQDSMDENLSVPDSRNLVKSYLEGEDLLSIENWQAERISRTEVGSAYQSGSWESVNENNEGVLKSWMTSGWGNVRDAHQAFEDLGDVEMDYEFAPGLEYPQDPNCDDPALVINCNCVIIYNTGI